jgi:hypothetical protein
MTQYFNFCETYEASWDRGSYPAEGTDGRPRFTALCTVVMVGGMRCRILKDYASGPNRIQSIASHSISSDRGI